MVESVEDQAPNDAIARRLRELGFVKGERVEVMAAGPISAEPLLIQIGFTRFALRRSEAARIRIQPIGSQPIGSETVRNEPVQSQPDAGGSDA